MFELGRELVPFRWGVLNFPACGWEGIVIWSRYRGLDVDVDLVMVGLFIEL